MRRSKSDYVIHTVRNALRVLEEYRDEGDLGVTELSRRLNLHKNNVFRILATLEEAGYVEQVGENEAYRLGVRCLELGSAYGASRSLLRLARPVLVDLARRSGESAHIGEMRDFGVVHLDGEQSGQIVQTGLRVGRTLPVHCTALGKVLLACQPAEAERFDREVASLGALPARTPQTLADRDKLLEHLHGVSAQGYALDVEECERGLCCAAAPVYDATGRLVAAISISGPAFRLPEDALQRTAVPAVLAAAHHLSRQLGYVQAA
jgi:IclR family transcriptional regulator, KDG regulon repressor